MNLLTVSIIATVVIIIADWIYSNRHKPIVAGLISFVVNALVLLLLATVIVGPTIAAMFAHATREITTEEYSHISDLSKISPDGKSFILSKLEDGKITNNEYVEVVDFLGDISKQKIVKSIKETP